MKTRVLLVRHGGTVLSAKDRFAGSLDVMLSDEGRSQAAALGRRLEPVRIDAAFCSDMKRAMDTAGAVCKSHGLTPVPVPGLREVDHGKWEGLVHKEVEVKFAAEYAAWNADPFTAAPPGGETGLQVLARALPALQQIVASHPGKTVLVVSHKATNRVLLAFLLGIDPRTYRDRLAQDLACLNVLDFSDPSHARGVVLNDISHYATLPA
ncbi:MAG: Alpha-ribazole-5-phosphate phosphatase [Phycisphaerales bacterium]|nr:Alpha-ribazole-5-phosphate phosphatase [Phycisphaerales bacterium]MDB5356716.1 Alpha-ribazole-5-phosphate phosphatase [Phycisphaerales bacterium]